MTVHQNTESNPKGIVSDYSKFLNDKIKTIQDSGFEIMESDLNPKLKDFQSFAIKIALKKGKFAFFFDCGLGKTFCQLEWANQVSKHTGKPVLILAPLAIVHQTIDEGDKFGIPVKYYQGVVDGEFIDGIFITNYDQLENINVSDFSGIVLDESSILKNESGVLSNLIINKFRGFQYKLACTATPSPNDHMELGMHAQFLDAMTYQEMLAMYFVHDGGETSKWRIRKHAQDDFWKFVCSWSLAIDHPRTLGFNSEGYDLPEIEYIEHFIPVENNTMTLFGDVAISATDLHRDLKRSLADRLTATQKLSSSLNDQWIIWALSNEETGMLSKTIENSVNVQGSDSAKYKADKLSGFAKGEFKRLITKTSIAAMGMNYQNCCNMIFMSYDFKFEQFYQAVRRCYRFGQKRKVTVHLLVPTSQYNVRASIIEKQKNHFEMIQQMAKYSANSDYRKNKPKREYKKMIIKLPKFVV